MFFCHTFQMKRVLNYTIIECVLSPYIILIWQFFVRNFSRTLCVTRVKNAKNYIAFIIVYKSLTQIRSLTCHSEYNHNQTMCVKWIFCVFVSMCVCLFAIAIGYLYENNRSSENRSEALWGFIAKYELFVVTFWYL